MARKILQPGGPKSGLTSSQRELAAAVGVSIGGMHYVLNALIEKGLVKLRNFTAAEDKRRYDYVLTPNGIKENSLITGRFLKRKLAEYEALKQEIEELQREQQAFDQGLPNSADRAK